MRSFMLAKKLTCFDITDPRILQLAKGAHAHYKERLAEEEKKKAEDARKAQEEAVQHALQVRLNQSKRLKKVTATVISQEEDLERLRREATLAQETMDQARAIEVAKLEELRKKEAEYAAALKKQQIVQKRLVNEVTGDASASKAKKKKNGD